jgi:hypothetical protein
MSNGSVFLWGWAMPCLALRRVILGFERNSWFLLRLCEWQQNNRWQGMALPHVAVELSDIRSSSPGMRRLPIGGQVGNLPYML